MLCKATTTSFSLWSVTARDRTQDLPLTRQTLLTTRPPRQLQISGDAINWIIMVVWKPFNKQKNFRLGQIQRVC